MTAWIHNNIPGPPPNNIPVPPPPSVIILVIAWLLYIISYICYTILYNTMLYICYYKCGLSVSLSRKSDKHQRKAQSTKAVTHCLAPGPPSSLPALSSAGSGQTSRKAVAGKLHCLPGAASSQSCPQTREGLLCALLQAR